MPHLPEDLKDFLGQTLLFRGLSAQTLEALGSIALRRTYYKNETIFWEGDEGSGFFIVISGRVKVFKATPAGKEQILQLFSTAEHFAEVAAFDGEPFPASAAAVENSEVLFFPRSAFLSLLQQHPSLAVNMLAIFARHLRRLARVIEDLALRDVPQRLAVYLLYLQERQGGAIEVELDITKGQLAALLGTIPETLSRGFAKLSQTGAIAVDGSKIRVLESDRLRDLAEGT
ncbi:Crp/Fnr family transcriptional regulator [[Phormidium] sp. ETS-05]|uniref:Crp/Fnr family transcriptional regulator n=1 Tax=[Phormidium] sp. ETS-05 TaxID=222819 RepID=UPI0018EF0332|nr:Crp/Fnr family transcriptional regulator [[Phormidium] sp. ETS-05]